MKMREQVFMVAVTLAVAAQAAVLTAPKAAFKLPPNYQLFTRDDTTVGNVEDERLGGNQDTSYTSATYNPHHTPVLQYPEDTVTNIEDEKLGMRDTAASDFSIVNNLDQQKELAIDLSKLWPTLSSFSAPNNVHHPQIFQLPENTVINNEDEQLGNQDIVSTFSHFPMPSNLYPTQFVHYPQNIYPSPLLQHVSSGRHLVWSRTPHFVSRNVAPSYFVNPIVKYIQNNDITEPSQFQTVSAVANNRIDTPSRTIQPAPLLVPQVVLSKYHSQDEKGGYSWGYEGGPTSRKETRDHEGRVEGEYSYSGPEGVAYRYNYKADENGYRVTGGPVESSEKTTPVEGENALEPVANKTGKLTVGDITMAY